MRQRPPFINSQRGFSLLELLIYIAIFGAIVLGVTQVLVTIVTGREGTNSRYEVQQNLRFASERVRQLVFDASSFTVSGACPFNTLEVTISSATTTVSISGGVLQTSTTTGTESLTSSLVTATTSASCLFTKTTNPSPAKPTLTFDLTIKYNDQGNPQLKFEDAVKTTISQRQ